MYQKVLLVALKVNSLDGATIWEGWSTLFGEENGPKPTKNVSAKRFQRLKKTLAEGSLPNDSSMIKFKQKKYPRNRGRKASKARRKASSSDSAADSSEFEI
ncbi:hypothetical protein M409DRAFT_21231 [Zasmidium cellare ATCC 36951]|uniref:Uncharacterized protein n=1 Tax=Zasmidium cellare ATCC 36951 TaxID=1080233 RepID=A0A6A6CRM9_ZASCE|nr:uncharacterized protein M409DRAFT_21231 [Zasmidium cellare ATCC 36951]KAF2168482.1 hypothetical protein M409DRAFT_21231 [Zasmidium cellare ATCC 36951]